MKPGPLLEGRRVLIVEDQYLVADEMRRAVERLGGEVSGPASGLQRAFDLLADERIDLALLDLNLGGQDGYPAARELLRRKIPFLFATGCESWVIPAEFGDVLHLEKPVTTKTLSEAILRLGVRPRSDRGAAG
jgi:CheY-like chemotaxis protein